MKLNTLLLTSAATLMVTSVAFAADLPSKKAAPAGGAVQICTVGGMKGWTVPDTGVCLDIGGRVTAQAGYNLDSTSDDGALDFTAPNGVSGWAGGYRVHFDARSNSEIGVVRSFIEIDGGATNKAYVQFAGLTAGVKDSLTDVYGTSGNLNPLAGNPTTGVDYAIAAGGLTFAIGAENPLNRDGLVSAGTNGATYALTALSSDRPDLIAALGGKVGDVGFKVAIASHQAVESLGAIGSTVAAPATYDTYNGYAVKAAVNAKLGSLGFIVFGGMAEGASSYIGGAPAWTGAAGSYVDLNSADEHSEASSIGGEINANLGKATVAFQAARYENKLGSWELTTDEFDAYVSYTVAKGLTIQPEYAYYKYDYKTGTDTDSSHLFVRIQRDF